MLKTNRRASILLLASLLLAAPFTAARLARAAEDTELAKQMEQMDDEMKKLRKSLKDAASNAASLESLTKLQQWTVTAKALTPAMAAAMPEAEKAKFVAAYRKDMAGLLAAYAQIEVAVLDNDNAKAEELFKGLKQIEDDGHEKYSEE
jgi:hypothetical protein